MAESNPTGDSSIAQWLKDKGYSEAEVWLSTIIRR